MGSVPLSTYLLVGIMLVIIFFLPAHAWRLGTVIKRLKGHLRPQDKQYEALTCWHWGFGTVLASGLHMLWFLPWVWYLKLPRSLRCEDPEEERTRFWGSLPPCPEPRAYVEVVAIVIPILGVMLVSYITVVMLDVSPRRVDPVVYPYLGCAVGCLSMIGCAVLYVVLASA